MTYPLPPRSRSRESRIHGVLRRHRGRLAALVDPAAGRNRDQLSQAMKGAGDTIGECLVRAIAAADPTHCGTYIAWLARQWIEGRFRLEDTDRVRDDLLLFDRNRHRMDGGARDIGTYATPQALLAAVRGFRTGFAGGAGRERPEMLAPPHARVIRDDDAYRVVMPLTPEGAAYWGDGSEWCITWGVPGTRHADRTGRFDHYARSGPFLIVLRHADASLWAVHLVGGSDVLSLWDRDDRQQDYPLRELFSWPGFLEGDVLAEIVRHVPVVGGLTEVEEHRRGRLLDLCRRSVIGWHFSIPVDREAWRDATPAERIMGIGLNPQLVTKLEEPTAEERLLAIGMDPFLVVGLPLCTPEERMLAVRGRPGMVERLHPPATEAERIEAIRREPLLSVSLRPLSPAEQAALGEIYPWERESPSCPGRHETRDPIA